MNKDQINWGDLFEEWIQSNEDKIFFLTTRGFDVKDPEVQKQIFDWERVRESLPESAKKSGMISSIWNMVSDWRQKQASEDYKTADVLRLHAKVLLQKEMKRSIGPDGKESLETKLKPGEIRALAESLEKMQRTQRLALGMSTDNVGVDMPGRVTDESASTGLPSNVIQLKPESEDKKRRITKLEKIKCWPQVLDKIVAGEPVKEIVRFIQIENKEYTDITQDGLRVIIYQWIQRNRERDDALEGRVPSQHFEMIGSNQDRVDPLDAANVLFAIHMDRILIDYAIEKQNKRCLEANTRALALANSMVETISKLESDILRRRLLSVEPNKTSNDVIDGMERVRRSYEEKWGTTAALVALNDESRRRVFNALQKVRRGNNESFRDLLKINDERAKLLTSKNK